MSVKQLIAGSLLFAVSLSAWGQESSSRQKALEAQRKSSQRKLSKLTPSYFQARKKKKTH